VVNKKNIRSRGKLQFSRYFQELSEGDFVAISREQSVPVNFEKRYQGITGIVDGKRGRSYIVKIKDGNKEKRILIEPIHLKKIKQINKQ
jgi:large subunit ribosomal protein L21e